MKVQTLFSGLFLLMGAVAFSSCGDESALGCGGDGMIAPAVALDAGLLTADVDSRAEGVVTVSDLSMTLTSADGSVRRTWPSVNDFNPKELFPVGDYTVEVAYADSKAEGFDCVAAYYDSKPVKIVKAVTTPVSLTAVRTQAMVSIDYTDAFKNYFSRADVDVVSASGKASTFVYSADYVEQRPAYIMPGETTVKVGIEKKNGVTAGDIVVATLSAEARRHYHLTIDVNEGQVGGAVLKVAFDDDVESDIIDVDLSDLALSR